MGHCPEFHQPSKSASYEISGRGDLLREVQLLPTGSSIVLFHLKWDFFPSFMLIFQVNMHGKKDFCTKLLQSAIKFTETFLLFQWSSTQSLHPETSALFRGSHTAIFSCMPTQPPFQITVALHFPLYPLPNLTIINPFFSLLINNDSHSSLHLTRQSSPSWYSPSHLLYLKKSIIFPLFLLCFLKIPVSSTTLAWGTSICPLASCHHLLAVGQHLLPTASILPVMAPSYILTLSFSYVLSSPHSFSLPGTTDT